MTIENADHKDSAPSPRRFTIYMDQDCPEDATIIECIEKLGSAIGIQAVIRRALIIGMEALSSGAVNILSDDIIAETSQAISEMRKRSKLSRQARKGERRNHRRRRSPADVFDDLRGQKEERNKPTSSEEKSTIFLLSPPKEKPEEKKGPPAEDLNTQDTCSSQTGSVEKPDEAEITEPEEKLDPSIDNTPSDDLESGHDKTAPVEENVEGSSVAPNTGNTGSNPTDILPENPPPQLHVPSIANGASETPSPSAPPIPSPEQDYEGKGEINSPLISQPSAIDQKPSMGSITDIPILSNGESSPHQQELNPKTITSPQSYSSNGKDIPDVNPKEKRPFGYSPDIESILREHSVSLSSASHTEIAHPPSGAKDETQQGL